MNGTIDHEGPDCGMNRLMVAAFYAFTNPGYNWVYPSLPLIFPSNTSL